jgi:hypothetical protein
LFEEEKDVTQKDIDLGEAKAKYRSMFEDGLHNLQRRWKKAGVKFHIDIDDGDEFHRFSLRKGPYAMNRNTGKRRRGWTVYWQSGLVIQRDNPQYPEGELFQKPWEPACRWPLWIISFFLNHWDEFMASYSQAVEEETEKYKQLTEEMRVRFGLDKPEEPEEVKMVICEGCGQKWEADLEKPDQEWICPECGRSLPSSNHLTECPKCGSEVVTTDGVTYSCQNCKDAFEETS